MRYEQFQPAASLAPFVRCFWVMADAAARSGADPEHVVPDGCMELILHLGSPFDVSQPAGGLRRSPRAIVAGQITRCLHMYPTGPYSMVGVRFQPSGASRFFDLPLHEAADHVIPLAELFGPEVGALEDRIANASSDHERIMMLQGELIRRLDRRGRYDAMVASCVERITVARGRIGIDELARRSAVSIRQLERRFRDAVGIPPKLLARIIRFRRVFEYTEQTDSVDWLNAALACGYFDQAHLIRDFRELAGRTPTSYLASGVGIGRCLAVAELSAGAPLQGQFHDFAN